MDKDIGQEKLIDRFADEFRQLELRQPPDTLYHYTSNEVLLKIIQNKSLWMTHALFMNDSAEFAHGMNKFKNALDILELKTIDKGWLDRIREFFDSEMKKPLAEPFVFSMTEEPDQLSQWRGYGDEARGVSLGFKSSELAALDGLHLKHLPVIYDHALQDRIVKSVMDGFIALILSMDKVALDDGVKWGPKLALGYFQVSYLQSIRFKNSAWQEEREWRAVVIAGDKSSATFSRTRGHALVKCFNLSVPNLPKLLTRIVIGPRAEKLTQKMSLESIRSSGGFGFEIGESCIPMKP